jgi:hypothetical protein
MNRYERIMWGWGTFLAFANLAVLIASFGFAPSKVSWTHVGSDPLGQFVASHDFKFVPWFLATSMCLSVGLFFLARGYAWSRANLERSVEESEFLIHTPRGDAAR